MTTQPIRIEAGIIPQGNNTADIGASSSKFKDLYLQGVANVDGNANVGGDLSVTGTISTGAGGLVDDSKAIAYAIALGG